MKRSQARRVRGLAGAVLFLGSAIVGVLFAGPAMSLLQGLPGANRVDEIAIQGLERLDARIVATASGISRGALREDIDPEIVAARIAAHPWVRSARVLEAPVGPLVVQVEERRPRAVLRVAGTHRYQLVDDTGTPFAAARESDLRELPHVTTVSELPMDAPNPLLAEAVQIGREAQRSGLMAIGAHQPNWVPELRLPAEDGDGWVIAAQGSAIEAVLGFDDLDSKLSRLADMLRQAPETLARAGRVDLRFGDHAVMRMTDSAAPK